MSAPNLARAARMAYRALLARSAGTLPVDPLDFLQACRNTRVLTLQAAAEALGVPAEDLAGLFAAGVAAVTLQQRDAERAAYIVVYRPEGNPARLRFTLAHELGHRILGHEGSDPAAEAEADCFASHLLCPEPALQQLLARFGGRIAPEQIAAACYVSYGCALTVLRRERPDLPADLLTAVGRLFAPAVDLYRPIDVPGRAEYRMIPGPDAGNNRG